MCHDRPGDPDDADRTEAHLRRARRTRGRNAAVGQQGSRPLLNLVAAAAFAGFVALAVTTAILPDGRTRTRVRDALLTWTLLASLGAGLSGRELWPFAAWTFAAAPAPASITRPRIVVVDIAGAEHRVDPRAWEPVGLDELNPWAYLVLPQLSAVDQERWASHMVETVELARRRARDGAVPGTWSRWLGPLRAPTFLPHPHPWQAPDDVPARRIVGLRVYTETWRLEAPRQTATRTLAFEWSGR